MNENWDHSHRAERNIFPLTWQAVDTPLLGCFATKSLAFTQLSRANLSPFGYCRHKEHWRRKNISLILSSPQMPSELWQSTRWMGYRASSTMPKLSERLWTIPEIVVQKAYRQTAICPSVCTAGLESLVNPLQYCTPLAPLHGTPCRVFCLVYLPVCGFHFYFSLCPTSQK